MAQNINSANFEELMAAGKPVVLDFWATWCGPCRRVTPLIDQLAEEYAGKAVIGKCNIEEDDELPTRFGVRNIPTILFFKNGEVVDKQVGACPKDVLEGKLKNIL